MDFLLVINTGYNEVELSWKTSWSLDITEFPQNPRYKFPGMQDVILISFFSDEGLLAGVSGRFVWCYFALILTSSEKRAYECSTPTHLPPRWSSITRKSATISHWKELLQIFFIFIGNISGISASLGGITMYQNHHVRTS